MNNKLRFLKFKLSSSVTIYMFWITIYQSEVRVSETNFAFSELQVRKV